MTSEGRRRRATRCWISCRRRTRLAPILENGIGWRWKDTNKVRGVRTVRGVLEVRKVRGVLEVRKVRAVLKVREVVRFARLAAHGCGGLPAHRRRHCGGASAETS